MRNAKRHIPRTKSGKKLARKIRLHVKKVVAGFIEAFDVKSLTDSAIHSTTNALLKDKVK